MCKSVQNSESQNEAKGGSCFSAPCGESGAACVHAWGSLGPSEGAWGADGRRDEALVNGGMEGQQGSFRERCPSGPRAKQKGGTESWMDQAPRRRRRRIKIRSDMTPLKRQRVSFNLKFQLNLRSGSLHVYSALHLGC